MPVLGKEYLLTVHFVQQILLRIEYSFLRISSREIFSKTLPGFLIGRRPGLVCTVPGIGKLVLAKGKLAWVAIQLLVKQSRSLLRRS